MNNEQHISEEAAKRTHTRSGWDKEACLVDAKMLQGIWSPEDTLSVIAEIFASRHPKIALCMIKLYLKINGKNEFKNG